MVKRKAEKSETDRQEEHIGKQLAQKKGMTSGKPITDAELFFASNFEPYKFYILEEGINSRCRLFERKCFVRSLIKVIKQHNQIFD